MKMQFIVNFKTSVQIVDYSGKIENDYFTDICSNIRFSEKLYFSFLF